MTPDRAARLPLHLSPDREVAGYVEAQLYNFGGNPFGGPKTAREVFQMARQQFGDFRCIGLSWDIH
jgi:hypothetical protein